MPDGVLELENKHRSVDEKYAAAWLALAQKKPDKGRAPFQAHAILHRLRAAVMHLKAAREDAEHQGRNITNALAQQGIALRGTEPGDLPWFDRLMTPEVAGWACGSARAMVLSVLDLATPSPGFNFDPLSLWKQQFREHPGFKRPFRPWRHLEFLLRKC